MSAFKLVWRVDPAPTGPYRSFQTRGWPTAHFKGPAARPAVMLQCEEEYTTMRAREGKHPPLKVYIAQWFVRDTDGVQTFQWRLLKGRPVTLEEAKVLALRAWNKHPDFLPKEM